MEPRYKKLLSNTLVFTISGFASKLLTFFLLPLYTSYYTTAEYGLIDLCTTVINLALPLLSLQISAAVLRFVMEKPVEKNVFITTGFMIIIVGILVPYLCFRLS